MALNHGTIIDTDAHFIIDPVTRKMTTTSQKIMLVQGDHNSERLTFEVPQTMEGHQMNLTTNVQIHFINIDQMTKAQSKGVTEATDVTQVAAAGSKAAHVKFSWLIPHTATKYQGPLNFVVRFTCEDEGEMVYTWSTAIYSGISVTDGINNGPALVEEYNDILMQWENELKANQIVSIDQTTVGEGDEAENVWTATFGDGRTKELKVKNGSRGPTGLIGSIQTMQGHILKFFVGTAEEYASLIDKDNVFAIITNDTSSEDINTAIAAAVQAAVTKLQNGETKVKQAETADSAETATLLKAGWKIYSGGALATQRAYAVLAKREGFFAYETMIIFVTTSAYSYSSVTYNGVHCCYSGDSASQRLIFYHNTSETSFTPTGTVYIREL